ncbi:serendipity locus protein delta [Phlebotomus argentipes]|uniref:serendipity locus protein delta n=1 Tax=Phlebotomus argentipes TaxID=94469 RepID=UPI0028932778|nr:serendipity locus protein delta [Phlebotomus argentipes]
MENYTGIMENEYNAAVDYAAANLSQALAQNAPNQVAALERPDVIDMKQPEAPEEFGQRDTIIAPNLREELSEFASTMEQEPISEPLMAPEAAESAPPAESDACAPVTEPEAPPETDLIAEVNVQENEATEEAVDETQQEGEEEPGADPIEAESQENAKTAEEAAEEPQNERPKEEELDKNQCRVCTSKENLVDIFSPLEDSVISDKIQLICRTVKIMERDFLPHLICGACIDKLKIALEFKATCENTDRELRMKLKRSKNKVRRNTEFVIIDADVFSDSHSDEEKKRTDDEEFHLSDVIESQSETDSSYSDAEKPKKYKRRAGRPPGGGQRKGRRPRSDVVFIAAPESDVDDSSDAKRKFRGKSLQCQTCHEVFASPASLSKHSCQGQSHARDALEDADYDDDEEDKPLAKRLKTIKKESGHECKFCRLTFKSLAELKRHKSTEHTGDKPYMCRLCNKTFKLAQSLNGHLLRHENEEINISCAQCWKYFPNKKELRKHEMSAHAIAFQCDKCKRNFTSQTRLNNHRHQTCPGVVAAPKRRQEVEASVVGRDLFKCVAPMTSTYWSDSFSE